MKYDICSAANKTATELPFPATAPSPLPNRNTHLLIAKVAAKTYFGQYHLFLAIFRDLAFFDDFLLSNGLDGHVQK